VLPSETKVLIIDDSVHIRLLLRSALNKLGFSSILEAADGEEGWQLFVAESPQLVFLDQIMPRADGAEILARIRSHNSDTRVIILSSVASTEKIMQAREMGADHYILKPFTRDKIAEVLSQLGWEIQVEADS
jgi:two-component system chemotaxis response regulator CheY